MSGSTCLRARWLLPIDGRPVDGGWVEISGGRILHVGQGAPPAPARDLGDAVLLPGLVNAHTHLELSGLGGRVGPASMMVDWIRTLLRARRDFVPGSESNRSAMDQAVLAMHATGTVLVGDVSNSLASAPVLAETALAAVLFHELVGFNVVDPATTVRDAWVRSEAAGVEGQPDLVLSVVAHAPYSVAPALFTEIAHRSRGAPMSVHLAESVEELQLLRTGGGPFRLLLEELGVWNEAWEPPACGPVEYLRRVGYLRPGLLAVHCVHVSDDDLDRLRAAGAVIVTCPRSNEWVGAGRPRVSRFYASGVPVAVGTDSLASSPTLNMFDELWALRRIAPDVSAASLLDSATRAGAAALGFEREFGTIAPGKRAALVGVDVPSGVRDVEEYLVSGVPVSAIHALGG